MNEVSWERLGCVGMTEWEHGALFGVSHSEPALEKAPGSHYHYHTQLWSWHCSIISLSSHFITSPVSRDLISIIANLNIHGEVFLRKKKLKAKIENVRLNLPFQGWWIHLLILFRHPKSLIMKCINFLGKNMSSLEWADEKKWPHVFIVQNLHTWPLHLHVSRVFNSWLTRDQRKSLETGERTRLSE